MSRTKTKEVLNQAVADLSQFAAIIHQTHWYMRGPEFLTLHPQMDDYMDEINAQLDELAERLITIGGSPYSTLSEFSTNTKLKDEIGSYDRTVEERVNRLINGYKYIATLYQAGVEAASEEGDVVTEDIFTTLKAPIEKNIWMLSAKLNKPASLN